jgi:hypothetical protein
MSSFIPVTIEVVVKNNIIIIITIIIIIIMWQYLQTEILCKRKRKKVKMQEFMYRDTTNVKPEMYDYTSNNWSHWKREALGEIWKLYQENIR